MALALYDEFHRVIRALAEGDIDYAVVGALALAIHGVPRATRDIDLLIAPADVDRVLAAVAPLGFELPAQPMTFSSTGVTVRRVSKLVGGELLTLDLLLADGPLAAVWASRVELETGEGPIRVVSREGLIRMKGLSGRLKDLADIERLEGGEDA